AGLGFGIDVGDHSAQGFPAMASEIVAKCRFWKALTSASVANRARAVEFCPAAGQVSALHPPVVMCEATNPTAALLGIGDEILSGRTKDVNIGATADFCTDLAIDLMEVRVVADIEDDIVAAVRALSARYTYVFTTGGIGPTHDDITAD